MEGLVLFFVTLPSMARGRSGLETEIFCAKRLADGERRSDGIKCNGITNDRKCRLLNTFDAAHVPLPTDIGVHSTINTKTNTTHKIKSSNKALIHTPHKTNNKYTNTTNTDHITSNNNNTA